MTGAQAPSAPAPAQRPRFLGNALLALGVLAAWIVGAYYRFWELGEQTILGDEIHALRSAATGTVSSILQEHGLPDISIPLALWNYLLFQTGGIGEWSMRMPMLVTGLLFPPLLTWMVYRRLGSWAALAAAWMGSLSPILILFSRHARPYMPVVFLSALAMVLWLRHLDGRRPGLGPAILVTIAAGALSPVCLPALGGMGLAAVVMAMRRSPWRGWRSRLAGPWSLRRRIAIGISILGTILALFAFRQVWQMVSLGFSLTLDSMWRGTPIQWHLIGAHLAGIRTPSLVIWAVATTLMGAVVCWRRARTLAILVVAMTVPQFLLVTFVIPWGDRTFSIVRYCMVIMPGLMAWWSLGLVTQAEIVARGVARLAPLAPLAATRALIIGLALFGLARAGPLDSIFRAHNSFTNMWPTRIPYPTPPSPGENPGWPRFYDFITGLPDNAVLLESPSISLDRVSLVPYASYQQVHRKRVVLINRRETFRAPGMKLRTTKVVKLTGVLNLGAARLLIVHMNFPGERLHMHRLRENRLASLRGLPPGSAARSKPRGMNTDEFLNDRASILVAACEQDTSLTKVYEDEWIQVFSRHRPTIAAAQEWLANNPR